MKITAGLAMLGELDALIAAGAEEIYCGVVPGSFANGRSPCLLNRRYESKANLGSMADLKKLTRRAGAKGVPVYVALNEHAYDPAMIPALVRFSREAAEAGAKAVIVSDVALMLAIRRARVPIGIHVSSVATCTNSEAAAFFVDIGVQRIILPRHLSVRQIARICAAGLPVEYESFAMNDGCGFEEGLCMTMHWDSGPMCQMDWRTEPRPGPAAPPGLAAGWEENWQAYRRLMQALDNGGGAVSAKGIPAGPCGLCALPALAAAGITSVKVAGRVNSPALRLGGVRLTRAVLDRVARGDAPEKIAAHARTLREMPGLCKSTYTCYYREGRGAR